jgi:hypothetical protein
VKLFVLGAEDDGVEFADAAASSMVRRIFFIRSSRFFLAASSRVVESTEEILVRGDSVGVVVAAESAAVESAVLGFFTSTTCFFVSPAACDRSFSFLDMAKVKIAFAIPCQWMPCFSFKTFNTPLLTDIDLRRVRG